MFSLLRDNDIREFIISDPMFAESLSISWFNKINHDRKS